jgi:hypothetical protein
VRWARSDADVDTIAQARGELLAKPLSVDDAVQVALLNNRGLQADFQELGITEAEVVQAGRLPNPGFSFGRSSRGDERRDRARAALQPRAPGGHAVDRRMEARRFEQVRGAWR